MHLAAVRRPEDQFVKIQWLPRSLLVNETPSRLQQAPKPRDHPGDASGRRLRLQATTDSSPGRRADRRWPVAKPIIRPRARCVGCASQRATGPAPHRSLRRVPGWPFRSLRRDCAPALRLHPSQARRPRVRSPQRAESLRGTVEEPICSNRISASIVRHRHPDLREPLPQISFLDRPRLPTRLQHLVGGERTACLHERSSCFKLSSAGRGSSDTGSTPAAPYGGADPKRREAGLDERGLRRPGHDHAQSCSQSLKWRYRPRRGASLRASGRQSSLITTAPRC